MVGCDPDKTNAALRSVALVVTLAVVAIAAVSYGDSQLPTGVALAAMATPSAQTDFQDPTPSPVPDPTLPPGPPRAFFEVHGARHEMAAGTHCWFPYGCVDTAALITPKEEVAVDSPTSVVFHVDLEERVATESLWAVPVRLGDAEQITSGMWVGKLAWWDSIGPGQALPMLPGQPPSAALELNAGLYVLVWDIRCGGGDASYGVLVQVDQERIYVPIAARDALAGRPTATRRRQLLPSDVPAAATADLIDYAIAELPEG